ncbi:hypothetical protein JH06_0640 [Blastocystis sp. subtype 4]|uniref:hypothetical protein n=1 Tax=Blastocystis sp. subtype 4 TaxID=944170 RepID=UPI00071154CF|nr:hypothetical protein JH06_0640 [Blastocystis sp. subtype 4]KNB46302.1 hypothetical protein JH06_0640 [Blastocystis sp. subtype 4]|eukprot:XP_014529730.1 hypothetical protein JH06_0640 [Blastocystis sp. subtype 4]
MPKQKTKELVAELVNEKEESESQNSSEEDSENTEEKLNERMETVNNELAELDDAAKRRIRNLEFAAERYLWYPDMNSTEKVRCRCCIKKQFNSMQDAIEHLKTRDHKHMMRRYVIENCKDPKRTEEMKRKCNERKQQWKARRAARRKEKKMEILKNLSEEEIQRRKQKFQEKKARRLARKAAEKKEE